MKGAGEVRICVFDTNNYPISTCVLSTANKEVAFRRAIWIGTFAIRLTYDPRKFKHYRNIAFRRDNHRCLWCGGKAETADHIVPYSAGGSIFPHNFLSSCQNCNRKRGDMPAEEYLRKRIDSVPDPERVRHLIRTAIKKERERVNRIIVQQRKWQELMTGTER